MSVTVYNDVFMPRLVIAAGVRGKQMRKNNRVTTHNGQTYINVGWTQTLREFEVGFVPMRREAWEELTNLHEVTEGGAYGFLMLDPTDQEVTVAQGVAAELTSTTFQLYKRYIEAGSERYKDRKITRPIASGFNIYSSGVSQTYTLDADTGIVTIAAAPAVATLTWSGRFYVPVHFLDDFIDWSMVAPSQDPDARYLAGPSCVLMEIRE